MGVLTRTVLSALLVFFLTFVNAAAPPETTTTAPPLKPHIVYLVIDDWGFNNWAGRVPNTEFPTPNLVSLLHEGILLDRTYGHKFCGPSRAAIQSGRNPIHVTVLDDNLSNNNPKDPQGGFQGIPRNMTGIAQKLKGAGYSTHMTGKWHCGLATFSHIPHGRCVFSAAPPPPL